MADSMDRMTIIEHLEELRNRLIRAVIAVLVAAAVCYLFSDQIISLLKTPAGTYIDRFVVFGPMDGFIIKWKVALYGGIVFASPVWAWQAIQFILPGLTDQEKRFLYPALLGMVGLFLFGTVLGYMTLPATFTVLVGMMGNQLEYLPRANEYISLVTFLLLAWGLAFQTPIVILGLVHLGFLHPNTLRRQRRISYFVLYVFAQIATPVADPFLAPLMIMAPLVTLYEISIRLADRIITRRDQTALPTTTGGR